ncbi:hypothetical protein ACFL52_04865 [Candidatus Margulisiibacteriota bacterium]
MKFFIALSILIICGLVGCAPTDPATVAARKYMSKKNEQYYITDEGLKYINKMFKLNLTTKKDLDGLRTELDFLISKTIVTKFSSQPDTHFVDDYFNRTFARAYKITPETTQEILDLIKSWRQKI